METNICKPDKARIRINLTEEEAFIIFRLRTGSRLSDVIMTVAEFPMKNDEEAIEWLTPGTVREYESDREHVRKSYLEHCESLRKTPNIKILNKKLKPFEDKINGCYAQAIQEQRRREEDYKCFLKWVRGLQIRQHWSEAD